MYGSISKFSCHHVAGPFQPVAAGVFMPGAPTAPGVEFLPSERALLRADTLLLGGATARSFPR